MNGDDGQRNPADGNDRSTTSVSQCQGVVSLPRSVCPSVVAYHQSAASCPIDGATSVTRRCIADCPRLIEPGIADASARRTTTNIASSTWLVEPRVTRSRSGGTDTHIARRTGLVDSGVTTDSSVARTARLIDARIPCNCMRRNRQGNGTGDSGVNE